MPLAQSRLMILIKLSIANTFSLRTVLGCLRRYAITPWPMKPSISSTLRSLPSIRDACVASAKYLSTSSLLSSTSFELELEQLVDAVLDL